MSWSKNRNLEFFWPLKFLPFELDINEARIQCQFPAWKWRKQEVSPSFAKDLLLDLKYARDGYVREVEDLRMVESNIIAPACIYSTTVTKISTNYLRGPVYGRPCCGRGNPLYNF
jgi:hypothetical protein